MSKILELQSIISAPTAKGEGDSNRSATCQGNSCISIFCGTGGGTH